MRYTKYSHRNLHDQNQYMWSTTSFESVKETILNRSIRPLFGRYLKAGDWILEAGCGNGAWVEFLRDEGFRAVGIDNNREILAEGASRGLPLVESDVLNKSFPDGVFDACLSLGVIEHFPEGPHRPLAELRRVLRPGGFLFVSTPCNNALRKLLNHPLRDAVNLYHRLRGRRLHFVEYRFEREELVGHVRAAGFEVLETVVNDYRLDQATHSIGFYTDWPFLGDPREKWKLRLPGRVAYRALKALSPFLVASGILVVARKPS